MNNKVIGASYFRNLLLIADGAIQPVNILHDAHKCNVQKTGRKKQVPELCGSYFVFRWRVMSESTVLTPVMFDSYEIVTTPLSLSHNPTMVVVLQ